MMARLVRFLGRRLPDDSMKADPIAGVWYVGKSPGHLPESIPRFTELVFDRALAEHCGRACGPDCDGDCFALLYVAVANMTRGRQKGERLFDCLPYPEAGEPTEPVDTKHKAEEDAEPEPTPETEDEPEVAPAPDDDTPESPDDAAAPRGVDDA